MFLFSTTIAYDVRIQTKVSDSWYDLVVNDQGDTYFELVYGSKREFLVLIFISVYIFATMITFYV